MSSDLASNRLIEGPTYAAIDVNNIMVDLPYLKFSEFIPYLCSISDVRKFAAFLGAIPGKAEISRDWQQSLRRALHKAERDHDISFTLRYLEVMRKSTREGAQILTSNVDSALAVRMGLDLANMSVKNLLIVSGDGDFSRVVDELHEERHLESVEVSVAGVRGSTHRKLRECVTNAGVLIALDQVFPTARKQNGNGNAYEKRRRGRRRERE